MHLNILKYFILFPLFLSSQEYIEYHKRVVQAEQFILDSNYYESVNIYSKLFEEYNFLFAADCYTATQTAIIQTNYEQAISFMTEGVKQGLTLSMIEEDSILVKLKDYTKWNEIQINYDSLRSLYLSGINWELRNFIDSIYLLDNRWRNKYEKLHHWDFLRRPLIGYRWRKITKKIVEDTLIPIILEKGYPGEKIIGLNEKSVINRMDNHESKQSTLVLIILIHYYNRPRSLEINNFLKNEISKGNITPSHYASIIDFQAKWGKGKYCKVSFLNEWHVLEDSNQFNQIDKERYDIGLESLKVKEAKFQRGINIGKQKEMGNFINIKLFRTCYDS